MVPDLNSRSNDRVELRDHRTLIAVWLFVAAIFIASHYNFYFFQSHSELGDFAANALQVRNAKSFHELYGNYSRWGFHHPGPAFFYAYALGERVLCDLTHLVPSPYNAHALVGVLIQSFFLAWTITILKRRVALPSILPLVLLFTGLHFTAVNYNLLDSAFESIWPPHVLLFPFLCFLVACASVASGSARELVAAATAGCLLVHGHVAQPLFVVPIFTAAYLSLVLGQARARKISQLAFIRSCGREHALAGIIIAVFLVPIILDLRKGDASNLNQIMTHFGTHADDRKSAGSSLLYLLSFLCYVPQPELFVDPVREASWGFLTKRWPFILCWLCLLIAAVLLSFGRHPRPASARSFRRALWAIFSIALLLSFVWGILQNGPMYNFNSHFNFALFFVVPILLCLEISLRLTQTNRGVIAALYVASIPSLVTTAWSGNFRTEMADVASNMKAFPEIEREAPRGVRTKLLVFEQNDWPWMAGVALSLQRGGFEYAITKQWGFMLGNDRVVDPSQSLRRNEVALWKVEPKGPNVHGFAINGSRFIATSPPTINPAAAEITFAGNQRNAGSFFVDGWDLSEGDFSWSDGKSALLIFVPETATADIEVTLAVFPGTFPTVPAQRMTVSLNGRAHTTFSERAEGHLTWKIPAALWNGDAIATLSFEFPDAVSPFSLGVSADRRTLGYGFKKISFRYFP